MTNLKELYSESGMNIQVQSELRHYGSRVDQEARWEADGFKGEVVEIPTFQNLHDAGFVLISFKSYRAEPGVDGKPLGGYGQMLFENPNIPDTIIRVVMPTDGEGSNVAIGSSFDAQINREIIAGEGPNLQKFLGQSIKQTIELFQQYPNRKIIDLTESLSGVTVPITASIADAMGVDYESYTLNGRNLTAANAQNINNWIADPSSLMYKEIGSSLFDTSGNMRFHPLEFSLLDGVELGPNAKAFYTIVAGDLVGTSVLPPSGGHVSYVSLNVTAQQYIEHVMGSDAVQAKLDTFPDGSRDALTGTIRYSSITLFQFTRSFGCPM